MSRRGSRPLLALAALCALLTTQVIYNHKIFNRSVRSIAFINPINENKYIKTIGTVEKDASPTFVLFLGLEGTGHHLMGDFVQNSPTARRLKELQLHGTQWKITKALFDFKHPSRSLLFAHSDRVESVYANVVRLLRTTANKIGDESMVVAVNCLGPATYISYPAGRTQRFNYPNIDLFYNACDEAGVKCEHVYLYRDPYSVIASSTIKRHFNPTVPTAIHLYTSLLKIMFVQFSAHSTRNAGCLGFFDSNSTHEALWDPVRDMLGWQHQQESFDKFVQNAFQPPKSMTEEQRLDLVPPKLQKLMDPLLQAHENLLTLCRKQHAHRYKPSP